MLKKVGLFVLVLVAAAVVVSAAMAVDEAVVPAAVTEAVAPVAVATDVVVAAPASVNNTVCPVCGSAITKAGENTFEVGGKVYEVCCAACKEEAGKDSAKYAAKADEALKAVEAAAAPVAAAEAVAENM